MASASLNALTGRPVLDGLGQQLREMFHEMVAGPMPQHLMDIVDQLEAQATNDASPSADEAPAIQP